MPPHSIAHVITGIETGGAEMMLLKLLAGTDLEQWPSGVVSLRGHGSLGQRIERLGVRVVPIGVRGSVPSLRAMWRLRSGMRDLAPALVQGWMYHGNLAALAWRAMSRTRVPIVWGIRNTLFDFASDRRLTAIVVRLSARLSRHASRIIYNSRAGAREHENLGFASTGAIVIPNGFDTDAFAPSPAARREYRERLGVDDETVLVGRIGRYHRMKDHVSFLEAAALLVRDRPQTRFVLAGHGVDEANRSLAQLLDGLRLGNAVRVLGDVVPVAGLTAALDIACSSSAYGEGFPNVLGEAMACGVPCVTTDVGDSARIVGHTGRVVAPRDPMALAAACRELIDAGSEARRRLGAEARARVQQEFSLPRVVSQYERVYMDVLDSHEKRP